jgi:hypothetical protein
MGLVGCGGGLKPTFNPEAPAPAPSPDANVSTLKASDIAGTYALDSVTFEADLAKDVQPIVTLTRTLQTVTVSVDGKPQDAQARLDQAYLIITPMGGFGFYYSIVNEKGQLVKVESFQAGSMSGTIKADVTSIGFIAGITNGLADEQETLYGVQHDAKTITLTDVTKDTPTPHFSVVKATKE